MEVMKEGKETKSFSVNPNEVAEYEDTNEEKVLFEWEALERSFQKRDKDYWVTAIAILVLVSVIFIFIKEFYLILALGSALFLYYVISATPPGIVKNKITNRGIYFGELHYRWEDLEQFWFTTKPTYDSIIFQTMLRFPAQIQLLYNPKDMEKIKAIVLKKLPLIKASPTFIDKITSWVGERLPLENRNTSAKS